jgi:hypothetical protein
MKAAGVTKTKQKRRHKFTAPHRSTAARYFFLGLMPNILPSPSKASLKATNCCSMCFLSSGMPNTSGGGGWVGERERRRVAVRAAAGEDLGGGCMHGPRPPSSGARVQAASGRGAPSVSASAAALIDPRSNELLVCFIDAPPAAPLAPVASSRPPSPLGPFGVGG